MNRLMRCVLTLYPSRWRERYEEEMLALLEQHTFTWRTAIDLLCGALDARLDPFFRPLNLSTTERARRAHRAMLWAFPLFVAGYMCFLDELDDALYAWNRQHMALWCFKLSSEVAMAVALLSFLLFALIILIGALFNRFRVSEKVLRTTRVPLLLIALGLITHILYTVAWGYSIWNLPASTVQQMAHVANRQVWAGDSWRLQILGGILWMVGIMGYLLHCLWQSGFLLLARTDKPQPAPVRGTTEI